jgi:penicillin-insensitive murein endopeptidase
MPICEPLAAAREGAPGENGSSDRPDRNLARPLGSWHLSTIVRTAVVLAFASAVLTASVGAFPGSAPQSVIALRIGRSVGSPTTGRLVGGAHLDDAPHLRIVPAYAAGDVRWGLLPLVSMIDRAARSVRHQYPDAVLSIGHLSRPGGGEIDHHASHESGRDADLAFYVKNHLGKPILADHFVPFRGDGNAPTWPGATFDDARNWSLVAALVSDPVARVSHIFVASPIRARLLAYAARTGASEATRTRASELMVQPHGALPHDDHFHVRIGCPAGMNECVENPLKKPSPRFAKVPKPQTRNRGAAVATPAKSAPASPAAAGPGPSSSPNPETPAVPDDGYFGSPSTPAVLGAPNNPGVDDADGEL